MGQRINTNFCAKSFYIYIVKQTLQHLLILPEKCDIVNLSARLPTALSFAQSHVPLFSEPWQAARKEILALGNEQEFHH